MERIAERQSETREAVMQLLKCDAAEAEKQLQLLYGLLPIAPADDPDEE